MIEINKEKLLPSERDRGKSEKGNVANSFERVVFSFGLEIVRGCGFNSKADNPYVYKWLGQPFQRWKKVVKKARDLETEGQVEID